MSRALERMTPMPQIQSHLFTGIGTDTGAGTGTGAGTDTPTATKLSSSHSLHLQVSCSPLLSLFYTFATL